MTTYDVWVFDSRPQFIPSQGVSHITSFTTREQAERYRDRIHNDEDALPGRYAMIKESASMTTVYYNQYTDASAYMLAELAGVMSPDNSESPGAKFLYAVRSEYENAVLQDRFNGEHADDVLSELSQTQDVGGAVTIWTSEQWDAFNDLSLYNDEETEDFTYSGLPVVELASYTLQRVALRLLTALHLATDYEDDEPDTETIEREQQYQSELENGEHL